MKLITVFYINICTLGLAVLLNQQYPAEAAQVFDSFIHTSVDLKTQPFVRYRAILWLTANAVFLIMLPVVFSRGLVGINTARIKSTNWAKFLFMLVAILANCIGFLFLSLSSKWWTGNDTVLFFFAVAAFSGCQMIAQAILLKLVGSGETENNGASSNVIERDWTVSLIR